MRRYQENRSNGSNARFLDNLNINLLTENLADRHSENNYQ